MADNISITAGTGTSVATDDVGGNHYQRIKISNGEADSSTHLGVYAEDEAATDGDTGLMLLAKRTDTPANSSGTDGDYEPLQVSGGKLWVAPLGYPKTVSVDVTRPADTTAYAVNDTLSDSTSAPTCFTITDFCRKSGGSVILTDVCVLTNNDAATPLVGEIMLFNQGVTSANDNAAWVVSDADGKFLIGRVPFYLEDIGNNGWYQTQNLNMLLTASGSANIRFLIRVKNTYTPANAEVFTFIFKGIQVD